MHVYLIFWRENPAEIYLLAIIITMWKSLNPLVHVCRWDLIFSSNNGRQRWTQDNNPPWDCTSHSDQTRPNLKCLWEWLSKCRNISLDKDFWASFSFDTFVETGWITLIPQRALLLTCLWHHYAQLNHLPGSCICKVFRYNCPKGLSYVPFDDYCLNSWKELEVLLELYSNQTFI